MLPAVLPNVSFMFADFHVMYSYIAIMYQLFYLILVMYSLYFLRDSFQDSHNELSMTFVMSVIFYFYNALILP